MKDGFKGVQSNKSGKVYVAVVQLGGRRYWAGSWPTVREAAIARDRVSLYLGATPDQLNLPQQSRALGPASPEELQRAALRRRKEARRKASRYLGVYFIARAGTWRAHCQVEKKSYVVSGFRTERDAAMARDRLVLHALGDKTMLNFPDLELSPASPRELRVELGRAPEILRHSRYLGVAAEQDRGFWTAQIMVDGKTHSIRGYKTQRAAAEARDRMALYFLGNEAPLNFPELDIEAASPKKLRTERHARYKKRTGSRYSGVNLIPQRQTAWYAHLSVGKREYLLGYWQTERGAALAVDRARLFYAGGKESGRGPLNFPRLAHRLVPADAATLRAEARAEYKARTTSKYRGVCRNNRTGRWVATIGVHRKRHLGTFDDEVDAALAYDRAAEQLLGDRATLNFTHGERQGHTVRKRRRSVPGR